MTYAPPVNMITMILGLGLLGFGRVQVVLFTHSHRLHNLVGFPLRGAPIKHLALLDEGVHRPDRFQNRRFGVGPVAEIDVHIISAQIFQAAVNAFHNVFTGQPLVVDVVTYWEEYFS